MSIRIIRFICVLIESKEYGFVHYRYPAGNNPIRDYSSVETFDRTAPRMTSVMRTNAASLRDAGEGGGTLFSTELCISARCRFTGMVLCITDTLQAIIPSGIEAR